MRNIPTDLYNELSSKRSYPAILVEMLFDSGTIGMWTGYGTLEYNGVTYFGGGNFIGISPIKETQDLKAEGVVASLNGIPSNLIALALLERVRGRPFRMYMATVQTQAFVATEDSPGVVLTEDGGRVLLENEFEIPPYRIFSGLMDVIEFVDNGETATLRLSIESALIIGQRTTISRYTPEEQRRLYPNDAGLDMINRLQDKEVVW